MYAKLYQSLTLVNYQIGKLCLCWSTLTTQKKGNFNWVNFGQHTMNWKWQKYAEIKEIVTYIFLREISNIKKLMPLNINGLKEKIIIGNKSGKLPHGNNVTI